MYSWLSRHRAHHDAFATKAEEDQLEVRKAEQSGLCGNLYAFVVPGTSDWLRYDPDHGEFALRGFDERLLPDFFSPNEVAVDGARTDGALLDKPQGSAEASPDDRSAGADDAPSMVEHFEVQEPEPSFKDSERASASTPVVRRLSLARTRVVLPGPRNRSSYSGMNAFGVARRVEKTMGTDFVLSLLFRDVDWRFPMPPDRARILADTLDLVFVVSFCTREPDGVIGPVDAPWRLHGCREYVSEHAPTLAEPRDTRITNYEIEATLRQILAVDRTSGQILARYTCPDIRELYWQKLEEVRKQRRGPITNIP